MNLKEVENLPDRLATETIALIFQKTLIEFGEGKIVKGEFLLIISQLTDRQVMTYELLENSIRNKLDLTILKIWNTDSYEEVDIILSIVVNLGLVKSFQKIRDSINMNKRINEIILAEIIETVEEVGDTISNPYYSLEKFK
ncbi:hypothetical protein [Lysinibacillus sp. NPDC096212]|uniref:hypothetical protein n=1 Tax=Lysinibacillus sp. NPDC096212 TaxID=3364135 RepID=UPI003815829E